MTTGAGSMLEKNGIFVKKKKKRDGAEWIVVSWGPELLQYFIIVWKYYFNSKLTMPHPLLRCSTYASRYFNPPNERATAQQWNHQEYTLSFYQDLVKWPY